MSSSVFVVLGAVAQTLTPELLDAMPVLPGKLAPLQPLRAPRHNPQSDEKIELGRLLFFDPRLSSSEAMSCSSCHDPLRGYGDEAARSLGLDGVPLKRNTPTIWNTAYYPLQFWDGRAGTLESQVLSPFSSPVEMNGGDERALLKRIGGDETYQRLFHNVFGGPPSLARVCKAIAAFERSLVTPMTAYDRYLRGNKNALQVEEKRGLAVFVGAGGCTQCHLGANLSDGKFYNLGLDDGDLGRFEVTKIPADRGAFRTPGLRNIELTAPYFHNGALATLEEVIEFYDRGGGSGRNKSELMRPLELTTEEKLDLAIFLRALTAPGLGSLSELMERGIHELFTWISFAVWQDPPLNQEKWEKIAAASIELRDLAHLIPETAQVPSGGELKDRAAQLEAFAEQLAVRAREQDEPGTKSAFLELERGCEGCHAVFRRDLTGAGAGALRKR